MFRDLKLMPTLIILISVFALAILSYLFTHDPGVFYSLVVAVWMISRLNEPAGNSESRQLRQAVIALIGCILLAIAIYVTQLPELIWGIVLIAYVEDNIK
jgi:hypothetical protein